MKRCNGCDATKPLDLFAKRGANGRQPKCKACNAQYRRDNKERVSRIKQEWALRNKPRADAIKRASFLRTKPQALARTAAWKRAHPESRDAENLSRRLAHTNAMPDWANQFFIEEAYRLARLRTKMFGFKWHVDHIIPLRSPLVCGLHTHQNLQVIPAAVNYQKGNRL